MNTLQYAAVYFLPIRDIWTIRRMTQPTINSVLTELMARKAINARQLAADLAELDPSPPEQKKDYQPTIWRILNVPGYTPTLPTLHILASYFKLTVSQIIGETPLEGDEDADTVIKAMQGMASYKKAVLVSMARTLASEEPPPAAPHDADKPQTEQPLAKPDQAATEEPREPPKRPATAVSAGPPKEHRAKTRAPWRKNP